VIPERILTRPPSAELAPGQLDQDSLPSYELLDAILEAYVEQNLSPAEIVALGHAAADVRRVVRMIKIAEYKRRQSAVAFASPRAASARTGAIRSRRHGTTGNRCRRRDRTSCGMV